MRVRRIQKSAFTIVELLVIIAVIGILASITVVGYGAWQKRTNESVVKSDLNGAVAAMESARNFGNVYPPTIPSTFQASDNVVIVGGSSDTSTYCIQANSTKDPSITMYVTNTSKSPTVGSCITSNGLIGWWPLNGNANDTSGNNRNGTVNGATLATGKNGQANGAYSFNGSSAYIQIPTIDISTNITASAWVYSTNFVHNGFVIGKNTVNTQWQIMFESTFLRWRGGAPFDNNTSCSGPSNSAWHHVVATQGGSTTRLYIDGVQCATNAATAPIGNGSSPIDIGRYNAGYYYNGTIDDVRVYNRVLTASEVQALYSANAQ